VNGPWICDEGRLSYMPFRRRSGWGRPRPGRRAGTLRPLMPETAWEQAAAILSETARKHGGASVAAITSGHATVEEQAALADLMKRLGGTRIASRSTSG